ncbi:MAG: hypothetical protein AAGD38_17660 [Acidobacteriota bacterium]
MGLQRKYVVLALFVGFVVTSVAGAANSVGQPGAASLDNGSFLMTARFYYASASTAESSMTIRQPDGSSRQIPVFGNAGDSVAINALGDPQVLFYDYYAPRKKDAATNKATVIFYHGGGFQNGAANSVCTAYNLEEWLEQGFHGVVIGYRRGWWGDGSGSPGGEAPISPAEGQRFEIAADMALADAQAAWAHANTNAPGHARWFSGQAASRVVVDHAKSRPFYVVIGNSAGGSLVSRTVHTQVYPAGNIRVIGAIVGFGTHDATEPVLASHNDVPTLVVTGLLDDISPVYDQPIFFDDDAPLAKGTFDFYDELLQNGYAARLLVSAQKGHGWASFGKSSGNAFCTKSIPDFAIDPSASGPQTTAAHFASGFFFRRFQNQAVPNYQHFRFAQSARYVNGPGFPDIDDQGTLYESIGTSGSRKANVLDIDPTRVGLDLADHLWVDGFDYGYDPQNGLGPLVVSPGFRYEPVQTDMENGAKPSEVRGKYDLP